MQLYLYLASNADGYNFNLSQEDAEKSAGIRRTTFHTYINLMIEKGYLVKSKGNCYDFYEVPRGKPPAETEPQDEPANHYFNF